MHPVTYSSIAMGVILALLLAKLIFDTANWKWRGSPGRPFMIGVALLILAFGIDLFMSITSADTKDFLNGPRTLPPQAVPVFLATVHINDWLAKLMELFVIPLAVAIIATALMARVDLNLENLQEEFNKADARIGDLEVQKQKYTEMAERGIRSGILDAAFFDAYGKLEDINNQLLDEKDAFREQFRTLADSGFRHRFRRKKRQGQAGSLHG